MRPFRGNTADRHRHLWTLRLNSFVLSGVCWGFTTVFTTSTMITVGVGHCQKYYNTRYDQSQGRRFSTPLYRWGHHYIDEALSWKYSWPSSASVNFEVELLCSEWCMLGFYDSFYDINDDYCRSGSLPEVLQYQIWPVSRTEIFNTLVLVHRPNLKRSYIAHLWWVICLMCRGWRKEAREHFLEEHRERPRRHWTLSILRIFTIRTWQERNPDWILGRSL